MECKYPIKPTPIGTTVCTVDFEIPNFFAVPRTVALVWIMNLATSTAVPRYMFSNQALLYVSLGYVYAKVGQDITAISPL